MRTRALLFCFFSTLSALYAGEAVPPPCPCPPLAISVRGAGNRATSPVDIQGFSFGSTVTIALNDTVTWTNKDGAPHTTTSNNGQVESWDSGSLSTNASFSKTFTNYGSFGYRCTIHPSMTGTVLVPPPQLVISGTTTVKAGGTLNLSVSPVAGAAVSWTGPNGFSATTNAISVTGMDASKAGSYSVTQSINGATSQPASVSVVVVSPPTASNDGPVCVGGTLQLSASTVANATYAWTGPNSFSSTIQNPSITSITAAAAGTYNVTVTVNGVVSDPGTTVVGVNSPPAAPTAGSNSPVCENGTLNLTATTIANATYSWSGPNGFTSTQQNPSLTGITPAGAGTYSVTATVNGCTSSAGTVNVTVTAAPAAPTLSSNSPIIETQTLNLAASTVVGAAYSWTGPNGFTSSQQNPVIANATTAATGTYSVTVTLGCTSQAATLNVQVVANAAPSVSSNSPVCVGQTLNLSCAQSGGTYAWSGPAGFTSTLQNPSIPDVPVTASGTYSVDVTINGFQLPRASLNVTVDPVPAAPVAGNNGPVTEGGTLELTASLLAGGSYQWSGPNNFSSTLQNPTITNVGKVNEGVYSVTVTLGGCTSAAGTTAVVITPVAPALVSGPTATPNPARVNEAVQLSADFTDRDAFTITWDFGDGQTATGGTVTHAFSPAKTYDVIVTATDANNLSTAKTISVTIEPVLLPGNTSENSRKDSDGDGFSDETELAAGSSATSASSTPFGSAPAGETQLLVTTKLMISLNFVKDFADVIGLSGTLPVQAGFKLEDSVVVVNVGGVARRFKLDEKGSAVDRDATFKLSVKTVTGNVAAQTAKFTFKTKKGLHGPDLLDDGYVETEVKKEKRTVDVTVLFDNAQYRVPVQQEYTAKAGKSGRSKDLR